MQASRNSVFIDLRLRFVLTASLILIPLATSVPAHAQNSVEAAAPGAELSTAPVIPQMVRYAGKLATRAGDTVEAVFRIYAVEQGGDPLWTETQRVTIGEDGSYSLLLGSANSGGLPQTVFAGGAARWLGVSVERGPEQDRVLLSSVPYAMKSADAELLAGHAASDFVTQNQLAQLAQLSQQAQSSGQQPAAAPAISPLTSGTVTGSGTDGAIPLWTGTLTQGNSEITQVGTDIGINEATPGATLDVGGTATFRGTTMLPAESTATASAGFRSQLLDFSDSAWSTTTKAPVTHTWRIYAIDSGNNSANPTSSLNFQFQNGAGAATPTILSIAQTGVIDFAPAQTFPGTIASVTGTSPVTATITSGAVTLGLNTSALETSLNSFYAQLDAANTFTGNQTITGNVNITGTLANTGFATLGQTSVQGSLLVAEGVAAGGPLSAKSQIQVDPSATATATSAGNSYLVESSSAWNSSTNAPVQQNFYWQASPVNSNTSNPTSLLSLDYGEGGSFAATGLSINSSGLLTFAPGQTFPGTGAGTITGITTTSPLAGSGTSGSVALAINETKLSADITPTLETTFNAKYAQLSASNNDFTGSLEASKLTGGALAVPAILGTGGAGATGVFGLTDTGVGLLGISEAPQNGYAGVLGQNNLANSATYATEKADQVAGVWGDTTGNPNNAYAAGVIGTADNADGGTFFNNSTDYAAVYARNLGAGIGISGISSDGGTGIAGNSSTGIGVQGNGLVGVSGVTSSSTGAGVSGQTSAASSNAVIGVANASATSSNGVAGFAYSNGSIGVYGEADGANTSGTPVSIGVQGWGALATGVLGTSYGSSATADLYQGESAGVWGDTHGGASANVNAAVVGTADDNAAGFFVNNSSSSTVFAFNLDGNGSGTLFKSFMASTRTGTCGIGGDGDLSCTGQVKSIVSTGGGARKVETYATQSAENWMEDYGTGTMERGVAVVKIDPAFAETISESADYHVFITPRADSKGLYVINVSLASFEVRESGGGTSSLTFDYKIVAKRRGYEAQRLTDVTDRFNTAMKSSARHTRLAAADSAEPISLHRAPQPAVRPAQAMAVQPRKQ